jgi:hypothetical protein
VTDRSVVYEAGMLVALLRGRPRARRYHQMLRIAPHRPVVIGPVLAQTWRPDPATAYTFSRYLRECAVPHTLGSVSSVPDRASATAACVGCTRAFTLAFYQRAGSMLAGVALPAKKRHDAVDAMVVLTAAMHAPAPIFTSDPEDLTAYAATLHNADIKKKPAEPGPANRRRATLASGRAAGHTLPMVAVPEGGARDGRSGPAPAGP